VLAYVACRVGFDEQVEVAGFGVRGDGRVGADDFFGARGAGFRVGDVESRGEGDVLPDWEAEDRGGAGQGEAVDRCVVRERHFFLEGKGLKDVWFEHFFRFWRFVSGLAALLILLLISCCSFAVIDRNAKRADLR